LTDHPTAVIGVIGAGIVGARTARELLTPSADGSATTAGVVVMTRRPDRAEQLSRSFGSSIVVTDPDGFDDTFRDRGSSTASTVIVARAEGDHHDVVRAQLEAGRNVVSTSDHPHEVHSLLALDRLARSVGRSLTIGVGLSPGLSCLLVRHAANLLDRVDEIHVARDGVAGPACARQRLRALRGTAVEWRDGEWTRRPGFSGRELCWFPDPIGGLDCYRADLAEPAVLVPEFPGVQRVTARLAATRRDRVLAPFPLWIPPGAEGRPGAARVEVRGVDGNGRATVVYGVLDRAGVAAAACAAVAAIRASRGEMPIGAHGLAATLDPVPFLTELSRRGVRTAAFDTVG